MIIVSATCQAQRRGGFSPPNPLNYGRGRGKPAPTPLSHLMFKSHVALCFTDQSGRNDDQCQADNSGVGRRLGERLLNELEAMGASFITCYIVADCEERFYQSLGLRENEGHLVYCRDKRPYVQG